MLVKSKNIVFLPEWQMLASVGCEESERGVCVRDNLLPEASEMTSFPTTSGRGAVR